MDTANRNSTRHPPEMASGECEDADQQRYTLGVRRRGEG
jgi:hypothetical protein